VKASHDTRGRNDMELLLSAWGGRTSLSNFRSGNVVISPMVDCTKSFGHEDLSFNFLHTKKLNGLSNV